MNNVQRVRYERSKRLLTQWQKRLSQAVKKVEFYSKKVGYYERVG